MHLDYHYLVAVLSGLPFVFIAFLLGGKQKPMMIFSGGLMTTLTPLIVYFEESYWMPVRLFGFPVGIEDVILNFFLGSLAWFCAIYFTKGKFQKYSDKKGMILRLIILTFVNGLILYFLWWLGFSPMNALIIAFSVATLGILIVKSHLWPLPLYSVLLFTPSYFGWLSIANQLGVDFESIWRGPTVWGPKIANIPLDEIAFAVSYAACYPLVVGFVSNLRAIRERSA